MDKIKNIFVTGGNGFLGSYIIRKLIDKGFRPFLLVRPQSNLWRIQDITDYCRICKVNGEESDVEKIIADNDIDCIIHLATEYGRNTPLSKLLKTNIIFPIKLIEEGLKKQLKLFINTDSFFAKSHFDQGYLKDYTNSKRILEKLLIEFPGPLKIVNMRIEHVYGENDSEQKFFTSVLHRLLRNEPEIDLTEGRQKRDFIYAEDVANAYISVVENFDKLQDYQEYQVGSGTSMSVRDFVQKLAVATGATTSLNFGALPSRGGDIPDSFANINSLKRVGWQQAFDTEKAIRKIINQEKKRFKL